MLNSANYAHTRPAGSAVKASIFAICLIVLTALLQIGLGARGLF